MMVSATTTWLVTRKVNGYIHVDLHGQLLQRLVNPRLRKLTDELGVRIADRNHPDWKDRPFAGEELRQK